MIHRPRFRVPHAAMLAVGATGALLGGCANRAPTSDHSMATGSVHPRPQEGMLREPPRPDGGYSLGRSRPGAAEAGGGGYRWNGNPDRIQEGTAPPPPAPPPAAVAANGQRTVTVRTGDTLYSIARHHGVSVAALAEANGLMNTAIKTGQVLVLP